MSKHGYTIPLAVEFDAFRPAIPYHEGEPKGADMSRPFDLQCPVPLEGQDTVQMAHGGGGRWMRALIEGLFLPAFGGSGPRRPPHDSAVIEIGERRLAFTTDTFVVSPLFFPGGDIGKLAVYGTVNDLAMAGARAGWLSAGFILEEGLPMETLRRVVASMAGRPKRSACEIVTGDTKVVDRGKGDGIFINTAGIGWVPPGIDISPARVAPGDAVLVSGDLGRHGMAIMSVREGLRFEGALESDCGSLAGLVETLLAAGVELHCLRDLTRGGLAAAVNEIALDARVGIEIEERGDSRGRAGGRGLRAVWGSTRSTWPTKAGWWRSSRTRRPKGP